MKVLPASQERTELIAFNGGFDTVTPALSLPPGFCRRAQNYEQDINGGYVGRAGYERYSGKARPSDANYALLTGVLTGSGVQHETITGGTSGATGKLLTAVGSTQLVLTSTSGIFVSETITGSSSGALGSVTGPAVSNGATTTLLHATYKNLAADYYRTLIAAVPGSGSVLGVWVFDDVVYAFRNNAGATAVDMYKATGSGWVQVTFGEQVSFSNANLSVEEGDTLTQGGVTATIDRIALYSGTLASGTNTGRLIISARGGGNFAAGAATSTGLGALTLSGAQTAITIPNTGGRFDFINARFSEVGNELRMYGCDGVNRAFEFDGTIFAPIASAFTTDAPQHLTFHKSCLWLSRDGSAIFSNPGNPFGYDSFTGFSGEIALGDKVTGFKSMAGGQGEAALALFARNEIGVLYGSDDTDFNLIPYKQEAGALEWTLQQVLQTIMFDDRGITTLNASQAYGNFADATISQRIQTWLKDKRTLAIASCISRDKTQYRLFFSDGYAVYATFSNRKLIGLMPMKFTDTPVCICSAEMNDGSEEIYFGDSSGFVYQMEKGTSDDGDPVERYLDMAWVHSGSPRQNKRYRHCMFEVGGEGYADFLFSYELGYNATSIAQQGSQTLSPALSPAAYWDSFTWDAFIWDGRVLLPANADMVGTAENVSIKIFSSSDFHVPLRFSGAIIHYNPRKRLRH